MKTPLLWRVLAWCVLAFAFGTTVYRARTQTIAHDEAFVYTRFLDGSVYRVLDYDPANHILYTLLAKPIVWALGVSEFKLRLPSLLGTAIYLPAIYLLCRKLFGEGITLVLSVALLSLSPQIMDFMPLARGYILGLAGLAVAMYAMARVVEKGEFDPEDREWRRWCTIASVAMAVMVLATFTDAVPVACLALTFSGMAMGGFRGLLRFDDARLRSFAKYFLAPGAGVGFCFLWPYLIQMRPYHFRVRNEGVGSAYDSLRDMFKASFLHKWTDDIYSPSLGATAPPAGSWQEHATAWGVYVFLPLLFCVVLAGAALAWRSPSRKKESAYCRLFGSAAILSVLLIVVLHFALRVRYPNSRYCLFLIPLFTVGTILAGREIQARFPRSHLRIAGLVVAVAVLLDYSLSFQVTQFRYNAYDVISLRLYQAIADDAQSRGLTNVRVGGSWWYEPEINFYRRKFQAGWMMDYDVKDKTYWWQTPNALTPSDYDYFVFTPAGDPGLKGPNIRSIFGDDKTGIRVVAVARKP